LCSAEVLLKEDEDAPLDVHPKKTLVSTRSRTADEDRNQNQNEIGFLESDPNIEDQTQKFHGKLCPIALKISSSESLK
jgi:hypothetical protein